ncbi:hypothetical protein RDI58_010502 [Solanum bulbocastanum]|uniref:Uncharacterized protein n=1 Tax=Solanum bulbocastanum TaxID=147425 RepID=A0AAN8TWH9_SOLBU
MWTVLQSLLDYYLVVGTLLSGTFRCKFKRPPENIFSHIQQPMIPNFVNVKSNMTMTEIYDTLVECIGVDALMNLKNELLIHPFDFSK